MGLMRLNDFELGGLVKEVFNKNPYMTLERLDQILEEQQNPGRIKPEEESFSGEVLSKEEIDGLLKGFAEGDFDIDPELPTEDEVKVMFERLIKARQKEKEEMAKIYQERYGN